MIIDGHRIPSVGSTAEHDGPFVIAEIGVNHDGDPERALDLVRLAADAGAHAVKFQLFTAHALLSGDAILAAYQRDAGESDPVEMLSRLELPLSALERCCTVASSLGVAPIVSVFSPEHAAEAQSLPWAAFKTASPDLINRPLLEALGADERPLIVSTGAATLDEVTRTAGWLGDRLDSVAMLQCVSSYPVPEGFDALDGIHAIARSVPGLGAVGYSDHTPLVETGARAVGRGASILEKHFTDDTSRPGPDHAASLNPADFAAYVEGAGRRHLGDPLARDGEKTLLDCERDVRHVSRQSVALVGDRPAGHTLTRDDLTTRRPGTGIEPHELDGLIGRALATDVEGGRLLTGEHLRPAATIEAA